MLNLKEPQTIQEAVVYFSDPDRVFEYAKRLRWPDAKVICPRCGSDRNSFIKTRRLWFCYGCQKQFTLKVGTIFEDSALGLDKWMTAVWMLVNCKNGISSHELARSLGVTQKSAWFMLHRIRRALRQGDLGKFGGVGGAVEADETFIGAKAKNMHKSRKLKLQRMRNELPDWKNSTQYLGKIPVMGMLDREARKVRAMVIPNTKRETLQAEILKQVEHGSKLYTDDAVPYNKLAQDFAHEVVNHLEGYVNGQVNTNSIENFWSLLKRGLNGTYVAVEPFHLSRYVDEQVFRFNHRKADDTRLPLKDKDRFQIAMSQIAGKRLTYDELTGKSDSPHHDSTGAGPEIPF